MGEGSNSSGRDGFEGDGQSNGVCVFGWTDNKWMWGLVVRCLGMGRFDCVMQTK